MCCNVFKDVVPPVSPASAGVGASQSFAEGLALWKRYYGLYDTYIRCVSEGCGVGFSREGDSGRLSSGFDIGAARMRGDRLVGCCQVHNVGDSVQSADGASGVRRGFLTLPSVGNDGGDSFGGDCHHASAGCDGFSGDVEGRSASHAGKGAIDGDGGFGGECGLGNHVDGGELPIDEPSNVSKDAAGQPPAHAEAVRGPNYQRNRANRLRRKNNKKNNLNKLCESVVDEHGERSFFSGCSRDVKDRLQMSRAARFIAENEREAARAKRELELLSSSDIAVEASRRRARAVAETERSLVSIEKTHATLVAAGDVPGEMSGFAATIAGSNSISANSSASNAEYRKCQKDLLDAEKKIALLSDAMEKAGVEVPHSPRSLQEMNHAVGIWTDNTENRAYFDETFSCYGQQDMEMFGHPGKIRIIPC